MNYELKMLYRISQLLLELVIRICTRTKIIGRENIPDKGPYVIMSNHSSLADPPLIGMAFRKEVVAFITKKELFKDDFVGRWVKGMKMIAINRELGISGIKTAINRLRNGAVLGIFPEGTRVSEGENAEAKKGIGFIVAKTKVPVVPVYIQGSNEALPKGGHINFGKNIRVCIGKKVDPDDPFLSSAIKDKDYESITNYLIEQWNHAKG